MVIHMCQLGLFRIFYDDQIPPINSESLPPVSIFLFSHHHRLSPHICMLSIVQIGYVCGCLHVWCICAHVYVGACVPACMCVCMHLWTCLGVHMCVCVDGWLDVYMCVCVCICVYLHMCVCVYVCVCAHAHAQVCMYVVHVCVCVCTCVKISQYHQHIRVWNLINCIP